MQAVSPATGTAPLLGPAENRGPEAQPDRLRHRASAEGLTPREGQVEQSRSAPESSTLPSCSPSPQRPPKGTGGALGEGGWGGVLRGKGSAALEWRPRVINKLRFCPGSATKAAVGSARPEDRREQLEGRAGAQVGPRRRAEGGGRAENNAHWVKTHLYTNLRENFPTIPSSDHHAPGQETAARPPGPATRIAILSPAPSLHWAVFTSLTARPLLSIGPNLADGQETATNYAHFSCVVGVLPSYRLLSGWRQIRNQSFCA